jgi:hypothetical protein
MKIVHGSRFERSSCQDNEDSKSLSVRWPLGSVVVVGRRGSGRQLRVKSHSQVCVGATLVGLRALGRIECQRAAVAAIPADHRTEAVADPRGRIFTLRRVHSVRCAGAQRGCLCCDRGADLHVRREVDQQPDRLQRRHRGTTCIPFLAAIRNFASVRQNRRPARSISTTTRRGTHAASNVPARLFSLCPCICDISHSSSLEKIDDAGRIHASRGPGDCALGEGVYFTAKPPRTSTASLLNNNYDSAAGHLCTDPRTWRATCVWTPTGSTTAPGAVSWAGTSSSSLAM